MPKLDGVMRTMMVTGETGETILVVEPLGDGAMASLDISNRTNVGADAALRAAGFVYMESLVCNENVFKETAHYLGEEPWNGAFYQSADIFLSVEYFLTSYSEFLGGLLFLTILSPFGINVHKGESYIRFWHDERKAGCYSCNAECL